MHEKISLGLICTKFEFAKNLFQECLHLVLSARKLSSTLPTLCISIQIFKLNYLRNKMFTKLHIQYIYIVLYIYINYILYIYIFSFLCINMHACMSECLQVCPQIFYKFVTLTHGLPLRKM